MFNKLANDVAVRVMEKIAGIGGIDLKNLLKGVAAAGVLGAGAYAAPELGEGAAHLVSALESKDILQNLQHVGQTAMALNAHDAETFNGSGVLSKLKQAIGGLNSRIGQRNGVISDMNDEIKNIVNDPTRGQGYYTINPKAGN